MPYPDTTKIIGQIKDYLHAEWAEFKKSGHVDAYPVCRYAIGGSKELPVSALASVCKSIIELEKAQNQTIDIAVERGSVILAHEVVISTDGRVFIYPPRKDLNAAVHEFPPPLPVGPRGRVPQKPEVVFMTCVEQSVNYMLDHMKRVSETGLMAGNIKSLYLVLSSSCLVKSKLMVFQDALRMEESKKFKDTLARCDETSDLMTHHLVSYHINILQSSLLLDSASQDWKNSKAYMEDEQLSVTIRMWAFYMQGLHVDLWKYCTPNLAKNIFSHIFTDTFGLLVHRYAEIVISEARFTQYVADVIAILTIAAEFLPCICDHPIQKFAVRIHDAVVLPIHRRAELLLRIAALKAAPVETIAEVVSSGSYKRKIPMGSYESPVRVSSTPSWLTFLNPLLYPSDVSALHDLESNISVYLIFQNLAYSSQPVWHLIVRGLLIHDFLASKVFLKSLQQSDITVTSGQACNGASCLPHLCTAPVIPHSVYSAVVQILVHCVNSSSVLQRVVFPILKFNKDWDSLDRKQVWNMQRPPWHHAMVQVASVVLPQVVAEVLADIPEQPPAQPAHPSQLSVRLEHHLASWTLQLLAGAAGIVDSIPIQVLHLAQKVNEILPSSILPVGGHVACQLIVSGLYGIVNSRVTLDSLCMKGEITDGQWDMMVAIGERFCSLHEGNYETHLRQLNQAIVARLAEDDDEEEVDSIDYYTEEEVIEAVCSSLASQVLGTCQGQHALGVISEFVKHNINWIREQLDVPALLDDVTNWGEPGQTISRSAALNFSNISASSNPLFYYNKIMHTSLAVERFRKFSGNWEEVLTCDLGLPDKSIVKFIKQRPEFCEDAVLTPSQRLSVDSLRAFLNQFQGEEEQCGDDGGT